MILPLCTVGNVIDRYLFQYRFDNFCMHMTVTSLLFLYKLSRLALLVLPFLCLRSLPPAAFYVAHWTSLIPHI